MSRSIAVIPARYGSTRLPAKALLDRTGKPLVVHVADQAVRARRIDRVIVATDDDRIAKAVERHGYQAVMTRADHVNGTSRIAQAVEELGEEFDIVVNVQGDEPEIDPGAIDALVERLASGEEAMATLVCAFRAGEDATNPNVVKVAMTSGGRAMYFSRALIPHQRDAGGAEPVRYKHIGIYAYRRSFLRQYVTLAPTPAEQAEQLEQLRVLEHGQSIGCVRIDRAHAGIDTAADYEAFVVRYRSGGGCGGG